MNMVKRRKLREAFSITDPSQRLAHVNPDEVNLDDSTPGVAALVSADPNAHMAIVSCKEHCIALLALFRALYWEYQTSHWKAHGNNFYGDHLLFQRLYDEIQEDIDTMAEKLVYKYGEKCVDPCHQLKIAHSWLTQIDAILDSYERGIKLEIMAQEHIKICYDALDRADELSLGWDDFLTSLANKHEGFAYLLRQPLM